ncbi:MAG TPA: c-type cytochrome [Myxococcales bacterium]
MHRFTDFGPVVPTRAFDGWNVKGVWKAISLLLAGALALLVAGTFLLLHGGITAKAEPTGLEAVIARNLRRWAIPRSSRELRNPLSASDEVLAAGRAHFADHCAICHANDGSGRTPMGGNLYPRTPDLRHAQTQQLSDGELFSIIENGVRLTGMPGFGDGSEESKRASWQLVTFIRHLPQLSEKEKLEMERRSSSSRLTPNS